MPQPETRDLHIDQLLTEISQGTINKDYIADRIFPIVPVRKQSNIVPSYDQSHWFRDAAQLRAPGTKAPRGGWTVNTTDTYTALRYSWAHEIADEERDNQDEPFNVDVDAARMATDKLLLKRENQFATEFFKTGVWGTDKTGGVDFTRWSDYANSDPLVNISSFMDSVEAKIAREANTMVMGKEVWQQLKWHPDILDTIKFTQTAIVSTDLFKNLLGLKNVHVGRAIITTAQEGTPEASVTYSRIWGKHSLLLYVPDNPGIFEPAAGYTFVWRRVPNALMFIRRLRDDEREVDIIEANGYWHQKLTGKNGGLFASTAVA